MIRQLRNEGAGIVYISHRLEELPAIADRVTVLRDGSTIDTRLMAEVNRQQLIQLMVGRELSAVFPKKSVQIGEPVLELRQLGCAASGIHDVNLSVRAGEIVGLAGLVGCGRTQLAHTVFGLTPADHGDVLLRGKPVKLSSAAQAIECGIAYVPEDRRRHGVILDLAISANITLASSLGSPASARWIRDARKKWRLITHVDCALRRPRSSRQSGHSPVEISKRSH